MKRYTFSLASVLHLRAQQTEAAELLLKVLQEKLLAIQTRQKAFADELTQGELELIGGNRELRGETLAQMDAYRRWAAGERSKQAEEAARCIHEIQIHNAKVLEAKRNQELLEKLKERTLQRWKKESEREEQALAEDTFMSQWGRRSNE